MPNCNSQPNLRMKHFTQNRTFRNEEPTWANACVGNNGYPQIFEYATGFASAAKVLLDEVIKNNGDDLYVDIFIYPICFNMRHAVELFLKASVRHLEQLANIRSVNIPKFDTAGTHHLGKIWEYFKNNSIAFDMRYIPAILELEEYINDIAEVDSTGQVFRYPFNVENQKHLIDLAVINVVILKNRFSILETQLHELNKLNLSLLEEYGWGSFTQTLSRVQLVELATKLPIRKKWFDADFDEIKDSLKARYKISSNEFSNALKIIQKRHEIAHLIDITIEIPEINLQSLKIFIDLWSRLHDIEKVKKPPSINIQLFADSKSKMASMHYWHTNRKECANTLTKAINPNCLASLCALFYFHREAAYSEVFDQLLAEYRARAINHLVDSNIYKSDALHLLGKTNAIENILNSLNFLGQNELLDAIIFDYDLEACRGRLLEVSNKRKARLTDF